MKFIYCLKHSFFLLSTFVFVLQLNGQTNHSQPAFYQQKLQSAALLFMENKGQVVDDKGNLRSDILFTANSGGAKIYLTTAGIHYQFSKTEYPKGYDPFSKEITKDPKQDVALRKQIKTSTHRFTVALQGANLQPTVDKQQASSFFENYYLAHCPNGITNVHGFEKIVFRNVYPAIDWVVYSKGSYLEYDFLVHPGGNPANIRLQIKNADEVNINPQGELLMKTSLGEVREKAPVSYADGKLVPSRFRRNSDGTIGFDVTAEPGKELRIDPSIVWSTYYGGSSLDRPYTCCVDGSNNVYLGGQTGSTTGITTVGGYQTTWGGGNPSSGDAYLVKFNTNGTRLWATYFGGSGDEIAHASSADANGNIYLSGRTTSGNAISFNGFQNASGGNMDAFLVKFGTNGNRIWSTYYGGQNIDFSSSCATDNAGNVFIAGSSYSSNGIASGGFQNTFGGSAFFQADAFLAKFNSNGNRMWGTYYGTDSADIGNGVATDAAGNVYLTGTTYSVTGIASGGYQNTISAISTGDAFLVKFASNGARVWGTYYGGVQSDYGFSCSTDMLDNVYMAGSTHSLSGIASGGFQNTNAGVNDGYLVKFNAAGNRMWATYIGGPGQDDARSVSVNPAGDVYVAGNTGSLTGIFDNGFQNTIRGYQDGFITKINSSGNRLWSSYCGGESYDAAAACAADAMGNVYVTGETFSLTGIGFNGYQNTYGGGFDDAFLTKIVDVLICVPATTPTIGATYDTICAGSSATLSITSGNLNNAGKWYWHKDSCNGVLVDSGTSITVSPTTSTTYFVRGEGGCATIGLCGSKTITVNAMVTPSITLVANPSNPITAGTSVTFTATATNLGNNPVYIFRINGNVVQTGTNSSFTSSSLRNGDTLTVALVSNAACVSTNTVLSNAVVVTIIAPCIPPSIPAISADKDSVCDGTTVALTINSGSLNSATQWIWRKDSCNGVSVGNGTNIIVAPNITTTYYARGEGGCAAPSNCASITIYVLPRPISSFTALPGTICSGDTLTVTFTGTPAANATYTWNWGGGIVVSGSNAGPYKVIYQNAGSISLSVFDGKCNSATVAAQNIVVQPKPAVSFTMSDSLVCSPATVSFINTTQDAVSNVQWNFGDGSFSTDKDPLPRSFLAGNYQVSLSASNATCTANFSKTLQVLARPTARFTLTPSINTPTQLNKATFQFTNTSASANRYEWRFGDGGFSTTANPTHNYGTIGNYYVSLFAYNNADCADTLIVGPLVIVADGGLHIPNTFSPNGDGVNDVWIIPSLQNYTAARVNVFNRWGQLVFSSVGYAAPWNGTYKNKPLPIDTYYYTITASEKQYTGSVTILR